MVRASTHGGPAPALALREEDFDPHKTSRARADLRRRIDAWSGPVVARLAAVGVVVDVTAVDAADEQRTLFAQSGAGALLALSIGAAGLEVGAELAVDAAPGTRARLADPARALALTTALEGLPEQFTLGLAEDEPRGPCSRATTDDIRALLERVQVDRRALRLGWSIPREVAVAHAELLDEQLADAIVALGGVLRLLVPGDEEIRRQGSSGAERKKARGRSEEEPSHPPRKKRDRREDKHERERDGDADADGAAAEEPAAVDAKPAVGARGSLRRRPFARVAPAIVRGSRVRVLDGPFSGKVGVVQELDGKGGARVMLGLLAVRLQIKDLAPGADGGRRPLLSSSHRKPLPARS
jgi:hypothetical protein